MFIWYRRITLFINQRLRLSTFFKINFNNSKSSIEHRCISPNTEGILSAPKQFEKQDTTTQTVERIEPWKKGIDFGHQIATNDSLLRWEIWPNWGIIYHTEKML